MKVQLRTCSYSQNTSKLPPSRTFPDIVTSMQILIFTLLTLFIGALTIWKCKKSPARNTDDTKDYFLAGGGLTWIFIAGSLTLTNINTDTLVGWNGNQLLMVVWWELAGVPGLLLLAHLFLPIYYREKCTTVTELLERKYNNKHLRATVTILFLIGNVFIFLPIMLYTSSLFITQLFDLNVPLLLVASITAVIGASYAIFGGLRAVAVSDTFSGVLVFLMAFLVVYFALDAIGWNLQDLPRERLQMIGGEDSVLPWTTLFTGMIFTQLFYWSTNQTITQRALAAPSLREAQKGCYAAALVRALLVPPIVIIPGLCAYVVFGDIGDAAYGKIVKHVLPGSLSGAFAAAMLAATMTSFNSTLNSSAALYVCDIHNSYLKAKTGIRKISVTISILFALMGILLVPAYIGAESIIQLIQQLIGLFSMPILAAFITGLLFRNVDARAVIASLFFGSVLYAVFTFVWTPLHFLHLMAITLLACVGFTLLLNRILR